MNPDPDLGLFFGRFHPVLLHLPIGFLAALAGLELIAILPRFKGATEARRPILLMQAPAAMLTAGSGWLLSRGGGYDAALVNFHFWTGLSVAALCVTLLWLQGHGRLLAYRLGLLAALGLMMVTSHFGGTLTHGKGYLTRYAPEFLRSLLGEEAGGGVPVGDAGIAGDAIVFAAYVRPVLERNCTGCHGPEKDKAGLRCDTLAGLLLGGDTGPAIVAGKAGESLLIRRMLLPLDDDEHMPPDGKPQPRADEVAVLRWWIDSGASETARLVELQPPAEIQAVLDQLGVEAGAP